MKISIVIPCFNEKNTIEILIDKIIQIKQFDKEIIVIDDFSNDGTTEILKNNLKDKITNIIYNDKNHGKGYCVKKGIEICTGDIVIIQDADLEYDPKEYDKLISPIINGYADVVYGSRFVGSEEKRILFFWHTVANKILTLVSNMFSNLNLTDVETCYKVFKTELVKKIDLQEKRFGFDPEITAKVAKLKPRIYEVGISYFGRTYEQGKKIGFKDAFVVLKSIIKYNLF